MTELAVARGGMPGAWRRRIAWSAPLPLYAWLLVLVVAPNLLLLGVAFLKACHDQDPGRFAWRAKAYEFVEKIPAIDLLAGSAALREGLDAGASLDELTARWPRDEGAFAEQRAEFLLYE